MVPDQNRLYLGIRGHVVGIRKEDGKELWRTLLKGSGFTKRWWWNRMACSPAPAAGCMR